MKPYTNKEFFMGLLKTTSKGIEIYVVVLTNGTGHVFLSEAGARTYMLTNG